MIATPSSELIVQVVTSVFATLLELDLSMADEAGSPAGDRVTSTVHLDGDWNAAVLVECSCRQACQFTGKMLAMDPPENFNDDVRDVLGEIANIIGGNIKSVISPKDSLSLPCVIHGSNFDVCVCGSEIHKRLGFEFEGGVFWITIMGKALPA